MKNKKIENLRNGLQIKGLGKFFHHLFMLVTYPIRKPLIFIPILIVLYLAPTFIGAKPAEVHLWYWGKIKSNTSAISSVISEKAQVIKPMVENINLPNVDKFLPKEKPIEQVIDIPQNNPQNSMRRKMFEKASETPVGIDVLKKAPAISIVVPSNNPAISKVETPQRQLTEAQKKLPLIYSDTEEEVAGTAKINNPNEIEINGKNYFFFGVYVDPNTQTGLVARNFLRNIIGENVVRCKIIAYTYQNVGTVRCYVNGEELNRTLVDQGYSKNVALD